MYPCCRCGVLTNHTHRKRCVCACVTSKVVRIQMLYVYGVCDLSFISTPPVLLQYLDCLWAQVQKLKKDRWQERHIMRPYVAFDSVLCEALQHNLPPFTPPAHTSDACYPMPRVVFRMFDYTDAPEVNTHTSYLMTPLSPHH